MTRGKMVDIELGCTATERRREEGTHDVTKCKQMGSKKPRSR